MKYLALMMDPKDAILVNTPQWLLAKLKMINGHVLMVVLHGIKRLLPIKIKVACVRSRSSLSRAKVHWKGGGGEGFYTHPPTHPLALRDADRGSLYSTTPVSTVCSFS